MALLDLNPMSTVEDLYGQGQTAKTMSALYRHLSPEAALLEDRGSEIDIRVAGQEFRLMVARAIGGNQRNVRDNLLFLRDVAFPKLEVESHYGLGHKDAVLRKSLYLPGISKIDLVVPTDSGAILFDTNPRHKNIVISSAPHGESGKAWWDAWSRFLEEDQTCRYYWNPARKQLDGGVPKEVRQCLHGRVGIFQVNEIEAAQYLAAYAPGAELSDLPEVVGAEWTVVTRAGKGIRLYVDGEPYDEEVLSPGVAKEILGARFVEKQDVGCGDSAFAAFIAAKEGGRMMSPQEAVRMAINVSGIQYNHAGSNLSELRGVDISALL